MNRRSTSFTWATNSNLAGSRPGAARTAAHAGQRELSGCRGQPLPCGPADEVPCIAVREPLPDCHSSRSASLHPSRSRLLLAR